LQQGAALGYFLFKNATVISTVLDVNFRCKRLGTRRFQLFRRYVIKKTVEKIDAQRDHLELDRFKPGTRVTFQGKPYLVQRRTTLASGEAAVVLEGETEQFVIATEGFLAGVSS
jgi:hypothetical protein